LTRELNIVRSEGIVLNSFRVRDADRMVVVLTPGHGKLKVLMKAASRGRNRFAACAEIGSLVQGRFFFKTPHAETGRVIELATREPFASLRLSIERIMVLSYVLNVVEESCPWHDPHPAVYGLLRSLLERLDTEEDPAGVRRMLRIFELKLLFFLGIHPDLGRCGQCGDRSSGSMALDVRTMTALCAGCLGGTPDREKRKMPEMGRAFARFYHETLGQNGGGEPSVMTDQAERQSRAFFRSVFLTYLGKKLKVLEVREDLA
jgi:DNA repair protein RecO (recombination protein O)